MCQLWKNSFDHRYVCGVSKGQQLLREILQFYHTGGCCITADLIKFLIRTSPHRDYVMIVGPSEDNIMPGVKLLHYTDNMWHVKVKKRAYLVIYFCHSIHCPFSWRILLQILWLIYGLGYRLGFQSHSCSWQLGSESESDSVQCENFCIVQCSHWVWSPNPRLNPSLNLAV